MSDFEPMEIARHQLIRFFYRLTDQLVIPTVNYFRQTERYLVFPQNP
jgi:hypothetical protein